MMTITQACATGALCVGVAVGLAAPASAQLEEGSYTVTQIGGDGPAGFRLQWILHSCGPSCMTVQFPNANTLDLRLQGDTWSAVGADNGCLYVIDNKTLVLHQSCADLGATYDKQLSKNS